MQIPFVQLEHCQCLLAEHVPLLSHWLHTEILHIHYQPKKFTDSYHHKMFNYSTYMYMYTVQEKLVRYL